MGKIFQVVLVIMCISWPPSLLSADSKYLTRNLNYLVSVGITAGNDELVDAEDVPSMNAGGGQTFSAGLIFPVRTSALSIQTTLGFHYDYISFTGHDSFKRYPFEIIPFFNHNQQRVGIGVTYMHSPKYSNDSEHSESRGELRRARFKDTWGLVLEYNYFFKRSRILLGARVQLLEYELDSEIGEPGITSESIDGSYFGLKIGWTI